MHYMHTVTAVVNNDLSNIENYLKNFRVTMTKQ